METVASSLFLENLKNIFIIYQEITLKMLTKYETSVIFVNERNKFVTNKAKRCNKYCGKEAVFRLMKGMEEVCLRSLSES